MITTMTDDRLAECLALVNTALEDMKAKNITVMNVEALTDVMERIVIPMMTNIKPFLCVIVSYDC